MKKLLAIALVILAGCGTVTVKDGNKECVTGTIGLLGLSLGGPLGNTCK